MTRPFEGAYFDEPKNYRREAAEEYSRENAGYKRPSHSNSAKAFSNEGLYVPAYHKGLISLTGEELIKTEFPPREMLLSPLLPSKGLAMLFAERGIGKTWVGLNIAHAVSGGGSYLRWQARSPRRVVYIDGEMPARALQERYAAAIAGSGFAAPEANFRLVAADMQPDGLPDLADASAQRFYDNEIQNAELIIVDNLSTLCRDMQENEANGFVPVQSWLLRQRAAGRSVLLIHHAGKGGEQRGTSKKEDVRDTVIRLRRPVNYNANDGARFEVHYTKARGFYGDDAEPFEARLTDGSWEVSEIVSGDTDEAIHSLKADGNSVRDIAVRLGLSKSAVARKLNGGR
jgi:putative DNA primase/helicase